MRKIVATFKNGENKTHCWSFDNVDPHQSPNTIRRTLERLRTLNIFDEAGTEIFKWLIDGKFVTTFETVIFGEESAEDSETESGEIQAIERLLPEEAAAKELDLTEKVDLLFEHYSDGLQLKNFRFEPLADEQDMEDHNEPEVFLRAINEC